MIKPEQSLLKLYSREGGVVISSIAGEKYDGEVFVRSDSTIERGKRGRV